MQHACTEPAALELASDIEQPQKSAVFILEH